MLAKLTGMQFCFPLTDVNRLLDCRLGQPNGATISPNSASCERVFSLLRRMFGDQQLSSLADYIQSALMLAYNERQVG